MQEVVVGCLKHHLSEEGGNAKLGEVLPALKSNPLSDR